MRSTPEVEAALHQAWHSHRVVSLTRLRDLGASARDLRELGRQTSSISHGWRGFAGYDTVVANAIQARGRVTCVTALRRHQIWVLHDQDLHVRFARASTALPPRSQQMVPHRPTPYVPLGLDAIDPPRLAIRCALRCLPPEEALVVCESAVHLAHVGEGEVLGLFEHARRDVRAIMKWFSGRSQSGTESLVRCRLQRLGYRVIPQVLIEGVGYVDMLLGERIVIECDSLRYHADPAAYANDRRRDLVLIEQGFCVIRLTYHQVVDEWPATLQAIRAQTARDEHREANRHRRHRTARLFVGTTTGLVEFDPRSRGGRGEEKDQHTRS